jgi:hypothetical protein
MLQKGLAIGKWPICSTYRNWTPFIKSYQIMTASFSSREERTESYKSQQVAQGGGQTVTKRRQKKNATNASKVGR